MSCNRKQFLIFSSPFYDLDIFKNTGQLFCERSLNLTLSEFCSYMQVVHFWWEYRRSDVGSVPVHYLRRYTVLMCSFISSVHSHHLIELMSAMFLLCEIIFFPLRLINVLWWGTLRLCKHFLITFSPINFSTHWWLLPELMITVVFPKWYLFYHLFSPYIIYAFIYLYHYKLKDSPYLLWL